MTIKYTTPETLRTAPDGVYEVILNGGSSYLAGKHDKTWFFRDGTGWIDQVLNHHEIRSATCLSRRIPRREQRQLDTNRERRRMKVKWLWTRALDALSQRIDDNEARIDETQDAVEGAHVANFIRIITFRRGQTLKMPAEPISLVDLQARIVALEKRP